MKNIIKAACCLFLCGSAFSNEYLVLLNNEKTFKKDFPKASMESLGLKNLNVYKVGSNERGFLSRLRKNNSIVKAEINSNLYKTVIDKSLPTREKVDTDSLFSKQWHLENTGWNSRTTVIVPGVKGEDIKAKKAWEIETGSKDIIIAVIDSGADLNHPDLKDNLWINEAEANGVDGIDDDNNGYIDDVYSYDFINDDNDPTDDNGHGSHCAGVIGAVHENQGIKGVMKNVRIMPLKFIPKNGVGKMHAVLKAIDYAIENGAHILSNSWGGAPKESVLFDLLSIASEKGISIIAAAGNSKLDADRFPLYPAAYDIPGLISVGATMGRGTKANFSNYGKTSVDIFAPGNNIYSTVQNGRYKYMSGTSMAAPIIAGIIGLSKSMNPDLSHQKLKEILIDSSDRLPILKDMAVGGRANAYKMLISTP